MNHRTNLLWLARGLLIGNLGLSIMAGVITQKSFVRRVFAAQGVAETPQGAAATRKPNIVVIVGEVMGQMDNTLWSSPPTTAPGRSASPAALRPSPGTA